MRSLLNALHDGRLIELADSDKEKALRFLAHVIEAVPDLAGKPDLEEPMLARERTQGTGIGQGVACPHVRAPGTGELLCAVGWSPGGIDYGASDGKRVHLVVMYLIPDAQRNVYLKEVSALVGAMRKKGGIEAIAQAGDIATVREHLLDWVSAAIDEAIPEAKARMIRLEARQAVAEAPPLAAPGKGPIQIVPVSVLALGEEKVVPLCQSPELAGALDQDATLGPLVRQQGQFDRAGYRLVFRAATRFELGRTLYEYLAIKL